MASAPANKRKWEEGTCSICQQSMTEPVSFDCGHSFCHQCIEGSIEEQQETSGELPGTSEEQPGRRRPRWRKWASNYRLLRASMHWEVIECLCEYINAALRKSEGEKLCEEHGEQLRLLCEDAGQLICSGCAQSPQHSRHNHVLAEDACLCSKKKLQEAVTKLRDLLAQSKIWKLKSREQTTEREDVKDTLTRSSVPESVSLEPHTGCTDSQLHCDERKKLKTNEGGAAASAPAAKRMRMEATCPICHKLTTDPVSFSCGQSCCHGYIGGSIDEQPEESSCSLDCPSCQADLEMDRDLLRILDSIEAKLKPDRERPCEGHGDQHHQFSEDTRQLMYRRSAQSPQHSGRNHLVKDRCPGSEERLQEAVTKPREQEDQCERLKLSTGEQIRECKEKLQEAQTKLKELLAQSKSRKFKSSEQAREWEEKLQGAKTKLRELLSQSKSKELKSREQREWAEKLLEGVTKLRDLLDQWLSLKLKIREWKENLQKVVTKLRDLIDQWLSLKLKSRKQTCELEEKLQDLRTKDKDLLDQWLNLVLKIREREEKLLESRTKLRERLDQYLSQKLKSREQTREQEDVKDTLTRSSVPESVSLEPHTNHNDAEVHRDESKKLKTDEGEQPGTSEEDPGKSNEDSCMSDEEPGTSEEDPGTSDEEPGTSDEEPGMSDEEPGTSDEESWMSDEEPGTSDEESWMSDEEPGTSDYESWMSDEEPGMSDEEPGTSDEESWMSDEEPGTSDYESWMSDEEPGMSDEESWEPG